MNKTHPPITARFALATGPKRQVCLILLLTYSLFTNLSFAQLPSIPDASEAAGKAQAAAKAAEAAEAAKAAEKAQEAAKAAEKAQAAAKAAEKAQEAAKAAEKAQEAAKAAEKAQAAAKAAEAAEAAKAAEKAQAAAKAAEAAEAAKAAEKAQEAAKSAEKAQAPASDQLTARAAQERLRASGVISSTVRDGGESVIDRAVDQAAADNATKPPPGSQAAEPKVPGKGIDRDSSFLPGSQAGTRESADPGVRKDGNLFERVGRSVADALGVKNPADGRPVADLRSSASKQKTGGNNQGFRDNSGVNISKTDAAKASGAGSAVSAAKGSSSGGGVVGQTAQSGSQKSPGRGGAVGSGMVAADPDPAKGSGDIISTASKAKIDPKTGEIIAPAKSTSADDIYGKGSRMAKFVNWLNESVFRTKTREGGDVLQNTPQRPSENNHRPKVDVINTDTLAQQINQSKNKSGQDSTPDPTRDGPAVARDGSLTSRTSQTRVRNLFGNPGQRGGMQESGAPRQGPNYGNSSGAGAGMPTDDAPSSGGGGRTDDPAAFFNTKPKQGLPPATSSGPRSSNQSNQNSSDSGKKKKQ
jgi:chemotaxis protein histidine kinase CheA